MRTETHPGDLIDALVGHHVCLEKVRVGETTIYVASKERFWIRAASFSWRQRLQDEVDIALVAKGTTTLPLVQKVLTSSDVACTVWSLEDIVRPPTLDDVGAALASFHGTVTSPTAPLSARQAGTPPLRWKYVLAERLENLSEPYQGVRHGVEVARQLRDLFDASYSQLLLEPGPLGIGLCHGDAHAENVLIIHRTEPTAVLCDLELSGIGPKIVDFAATAAAVHRYGADPAALEELARSYCGHVRGALTPSDLLSHPSLRLARTAYEVVVCAWIIAAAVHGADLLVESKKRIAGLLGTSAERWTLR